jgi:hypothetical protein
MADRTKVGVQPISGSAFLYGFYTTADATERTALGHTLHAGNTASAFLFGVNYPKPARLTRTRASGRSISSFCDVDQIATARAAGWKLIRPGRYKQGADTALSKAVFVEFKVNGIAIDYAWRMPTDTHTAIGDADRTSLGIKTAVGLTAANTRKLVWGCNNPKPPRAIKKTASGMISTFYNPDNTLPTGWSSNSGYIND